MALFCLARILSAVSTSAASSAELHTFYGEVQSVDLGARTFSIKSGGKILVFHYTDQTKISSFHGYMRWDKVHVGQEAAVVMRVGEGNIGIAEAVRFDYVPISSKQLSLFVARTTQGETVSGIAVANYVTNEPRGEKFLRATGSAGGSVGVFVLSVKPDGSVGEITAAKSLGDAEMDQRAAHWLREWRFKPNAVTQVQIPVALSRSY
ncbi:MAG: TonB family protein [Chthoniobacterales bacterium]